MKSKLDNRKITEFVLERIPDAGLRRLIFDAEEINFNDDIKDNPIALIVKSLSVVWIYSFISWKNETILGRPGHLENNANLQRIFRCFQSVYNSENINIDLILFTLTEMKLDVLNNPRHSPFKDIIDGRENDFTINQLRQLILDWQCYKTAESDLSLIMEYFCFTIRLLPILQDLKVIIKNNDVFFSVQGEELSTFGVVKFFEQDAPYFYYLRNFSIRSTSVFVEYSDFYGGRIYDKEFSREDFFINSKEILGGEKISAIIAQKLYSVEYKYFNNLTLAVADLLDNYTKERLFDHYVKTIPDAFRLLEATNDSLGQNQFDRDDYINQSNWDNVIAILMLEAGPSTILEKVINQNYKTFTLLADNLEVRFSGRINAKNIIAQFEEHQKRESRFIRKFSSDFKSLGNYIEKAQGNLMVQAIIRAVTDLAENEHTFNTTYVETLNMRIIQVERILTSEQSDEEKTKAINSALEKTLHFLIVFYNGVLAFAEELNRSIFAPSLSINDIIINKCEQAFLNKCSSVMSDVNRLPVGQSIDAFREIAKKFSANNKNEAEKNKKNRALLYLVLGRHYLCDISTFNHLSERIPNTMNAAKHYKAADGSLNAIMSDENLDNAKELLYFFIYNKDFKDERRLKKQLSLDPIYPHVIRYSLKSENRDGFFVNNYIIDMANSDIEKEIKILTEKNYEINEFYYCIPNLRGTLPKWWIKPFMIKCRDFDNLFFN